MFSLSIALYYLAALGTIFMAARYMFGSLPTPYHKEMMQRAEAPMPEILETILRAHGRNLGAGLLASGVAIFLFTDMIEPGSNFVVRLRPVLVGLIIGVPITVYTRRLEKDTGVHTPWRVSLGLLSVIVVGYGLSFL
ncbi:MAG: hypothetical protein COW55_12365 [Rhodobacteraceae bacterium CG17_big_fil_post_rev_8_21_14_2_50_65_11]|nr:MAG: hypothetical protein COW55_12365 [Rhodobacteraceae bacterium CG17_big_fil_post_rev_8_21_14_2_50_65_11]